ncbi:hypothetical protein [Phosphitispora sp. TUW77]|uniref:hypothetical protein n=1 Tax=Phosphitispora sp. TUW77 TaxID=3152361 RepID=UPI003AB8D5C1
MKVKILNNHIQHIVTGFKQQCHFYVKLLQMSQKLGKIVSEVSAKDDDDDGAVTGDITYKLNILPEQINEIMSERALIINNIARLEEDIRPHKEAVMNICHLKEFSLDRVQDLINADLRKEFFEQIKLIQKIIKEIIEIDHVNEMALQKNMHNLAAELKKIKQHHQIQKTYLDRPEKFPESRFIDSKK